jgi:hypothetical protein
MGAKTNSQFSFNPNLLLLQNGHFKDINLKGWELGQWEKGKKKHEFPNMANYFILVETKRFVIGLMTFFGGSPTRVGKF